MILTSSDLREERRARNSREPDFWPRWKSTLVFDREEGGPYVAVRRHDSRGLFVMEQKKSSGPWGNGTKWYAIKTLPRREVSAEINLKNQNIRVFIPKLMKTIRHARKLSTQKTQLFPRYGFVELDLNHHQWRAINGTIGVETLLMSRDYPIPVPRGVVEDMLDYADADGVIVLGRGLKLGSSVQVRSGPFVGSVGLLTSLDEKGRVEVLLRIMNGHIRVKALCDTLDLHRENVS